MQKKWEVIKVAWDPLNYNWIEVNYDGGCQI